MTDLISSILAINSEAECQVIDENIDNIIWAEGTTPIATEDILAKQVELRAEYDARAYARNRKAEYDALNQFEMQYDDKVNSSTTWDDAIEDIKTKYPKG